MSQIFTSYFKNIDVIRQIDPHAIFIAVSGGVPDGYTYKWYRKTAPRWNWWNEWHEKFKDNYESNESKKWYIEHYQSTVLNTHNANEVLNDILALKDSDDDNVYLLCFEDENHFCHRHLLADWLNKNMNCNIIEKKII